MFQMRKAEAALIYAADEVLYRARKAGGSCGELIAGLLPGEEKDILAFFNKACYKLKDRPANFVSCDYIDARLILALSSDVCR
jgi:hypothetical protein